MGAETYAEIERVNRIAEAGCEVTRMWLFTQAGNWSQRGMLRRSFHWKSSVEALIKTLRQISAKLRYPHRQGRNHRQ
jgi:hypothetical protein